MATRDQPPAAVAAGDDLAAAASRDDSTRYALARSRLLREQANRQIQAARERVATARRRRSGPSAGPMAQGPTALPTGVREEIERSRQARARLAELAAKVAHTEQTVAHSHDEMAGRDSRRAAQYRQAAEDARQMAQRAREIQQKSIRNLP